MKKYIILILLFVSVSNISATIDAELAALMDKTDRPEFGFGFLLKNRPEQEHMKILYAEALKNRDAKPRLAIAALWDIVSEANRNINHPLDKQAQNLLKKLLKHNS